MSLCGAHGQVGPEDLDLIFSQLKCNQKAHNKVSGACEEDELKPVGQLSGRCSENHPTLPFLPAQKATGSMSMVIQDEGRALQLSLSLNHSSCRVSHATQTHILHYTKHCGLSFRPLKDRYGLL